MSSRPPVLTSRDVAVLTWIAEMYGVDYAVLAVLLARHSPFVDRPALSDAGVRKQVKRWVNAGLVTVHSVMGRNWVTLTPLGYRRVGFAQSVWAVPATRLRHTQNVNVLRLWYESTPPSVDYPWISERRIRARREGGGSAHVCDAELRSPTVEEGLPAAYFGIEVELTHKTVGEYAHEVFGRLRGGVRHLLYYVSDERFAKRLSCDLTAAQRERNSQVGFTVAVLPQVEGVSYVEGW
jgi:hypothetical protein